MFSPALSSGSLLLEMLFLTVFFSNVLVSDLLLNYWLEFIFFSDVILVSIIRGSVIGVLIPDECCSFYFKILSFSRDGEFRRRVPLSNKLFTFTCLITGYQFFFADDVKSASCKIIGLTSLNALGSAIISYTGNGLGFGSGVS